jgi:hypothetical protein
LNQQQKVKSQEMNVWRLEQEVTGDQFAGNAAK